MYQLPKFIIIEISKYDCIKELRAANKRYHSYLQPYWFKKHLIHYVDDIAALRILIKHNMLRNADLHIILNRTVTSTMVDLIAANYDLYIHHKWRGVVAGVTPPLLVIYDIIRKTCGKRQWYPIRLMGFGVNTIRFMYKCAIRYVYSECFNNIWHRVFECYTDNLMILLDYQVPFDNLIKISQIDPIMYNFIVHNLNPDRIYDDIIIHIMKLNGIPTTGATINAHESAADWISADLFVRLFTRGDIKSLKQLARLHPIPIKGIINYMIYSVPDMIDHKHRNIVFTLAKHMNIHPINNTFFGTADSILIMCKELHKHQYQTQYITYNFNRSIIHNKYISIYKYVTSICPQYCILDTATVDKTHTYRQFARIFAAINNGMKYQLNDVIAIYKKLGNIAEIKFHKLYCNFGEYLFQKYPKHMLISTYN